MAVTTTTILAPDGIDSLAGTYYTGTGIKQVAGLSNVTVDSNLDNGTTDADLDRIAGAGTDADAYTTLRAGRADPVVETPIAEDDATFPVVRLATNLYAAYLLASYRIDKSSSDNPLAARAHDLYARAMKLYGELFGTAKRVDTSATAPGSFQTIGLRFEPECSTDEFAG